MMAAFELTDDGTMDTVVRCAECGEERRYTFDPAGPYEVDDPDNNQPQSDEQQAEAAYEEFTRWACEDAEQDHECLNPERGEE
jgi:hypothetical protein